MLGNRTCRRPTATTAALAGLALGLGTPVAPTALASEPDRRATAASTPDLLAADLRLPIPEGETWTFTGGPHNWNGSGTPRNSLDFAGGSGTAAAAGAGTAYVPASCPNLVRIDHGNGINTTYYHLTDISVRNGQQVSAGTELGEISTAAGCGGSATGPHVHFSLWDTDGAAFDFSTAQMVPIENTTLGDWRVQDGYPNYEGCLTHTGTGKQACTPNGQVSQ